MSAPFSLAPWQVPDYPISAVWTDLLHWCICVMPGDDPDLQFIANLLSYALRHGGLTERQAKHARRITDRFWALWLADQLPCQCSAPRVLATMQTAGSA